MIMTWSADDLNGEEMIIKYSSDNLTILIDDQKYSAESQHIIIRYLSHDHQMIITWSADDLWVFV